MEPGIERGTCYLIRTAQSARLYDEYNKLRKAGLFADHGLIISRLHPDKIRQRYQTGEAEFVWLTTNSVDGIVCAAPTAISLVHMKVVDFLRRVPTGIVVLDGAEYLITNNTFETFLRFVHSVHDRVMVTQAVLMAALDPQSVAERELHLLAKEFAELESL